MISDFASSSVTGHVIPLAVLAWKIIDRKIIDRKIIDMAMADGSTYPGTLVGEQPIGGCSPTPAQGGA